MSELTPSAGLPPGLPAGFVSAGFSTGFLDRGGPYWLRHGASGTTVGLLIEEDHLNYQNVAHGGVLTTLADVALSLIVYNSETPPLPVATASMTVNFIGAAKLGEWLEADARIDRIGRQLANTSGTIRCGDRIIATMTGVFSVRRSA